MKKTLLAALLITSLVGCSEQSSAQPKQEKKAEVSHPAPVQPAPTPAPAPQPPPNTDKQDMATYSNEIKDPFSKLTTDVQNIAKVSNIGAQTPSIISTYQYQHTVQLICDDMKTNIAQLKTVDTLNNPKIEEIQNLILQGTDKLQFVADNFPEAVNTLDANGINECTAAMNDANSYFVQANDKVTAFKASETTN